ncbi:bll0014 [Bradyrhizobium diazoefficiens USDA 110]|uniref:Bll0014 protein n=2 Tax=Bradyrhizobium TaxID=374 RepID=Q89YD8_BRADU|nr:hypothetical protein CIT37_14735 [Bradyrhizobium ottawaense]MYV88367.1 hypothetical protein [Bradyrhizobium japonicum]NLS75084.1 hypothetical protein [Bradyrhizobium brasilense]NWL43627.1 hypothetical protein [Bradyrhizobium elkanii]PDT55921.1 hypothetical protein CO678_41075 [Bradyrhizobium diazoefficiens]QHP66134.1 hypothetical protein EI171_01000 [Bradyrhizobium sp. LCT2]QOZ14362.1 hypothetical protein XI02_04220 [Bradyrhizobium sp. CCBAU 21365]BAC45279.1 bll0014 [Bradyrhizobium diazoe
MTRYTGRSRSASLGSPRELARVVGNDCAVEIDTNNYGTLAADQRARGGDGRGWRGAHPPWHARGCGHRQSEDRRLRIVEFAHLDGVACRDGAVCQPATATPTVPAPSPLPSLLRPLAEYEATIGGSF